MERLPVVLLFFLAIVFSTSQAYEPLINHHIHLLRLKSGADGGSALGVSCLSWRLGVETRNIINWKTVLAECESYVGHYMLGHQYRNSKVVTDEAWLHAHSLNLTKDGKNVWVFDTKLQSLIYRIMLVMDSVAKLREGEEWRPPLRSPKNTPRSASSALPLSSKMRISTANGHGPRCTITNNPTSHRPLRMKIKEPKFLDYQIGILEIESSTIVRLP